MFQAMRRKGKIIFQKLRYMTDFNINALQLGKFPLKIAICKKCLHVT